jgi:hypothetical protein
MLNISYDTKPIPPNISRIRLHVIDSFINEEKMIIDKILIEKRTSLKPEHIKKLQDRYTQLDKVLEEKRIFQIKLRGILSFRKPECAAFIKRMNEQNPFPYKNKIYILQKELKQLKQKIAELEDQIEIFKFDRSISSSSSADI